MILGVDLGTSGLKCVITNLNEKIVCSTSTKLNINQFDGILAMYHDQALIPFKTISSDNGVNFTAGLKYIRTSPDHGAAYSIAGNGVASIV